MRKSVKNGIIALAVAGTMCGTAVAYSTVRTKMIEANYMGIKLVVDGIEVTPKDVKGNTIEPFMYNGTTYLPVRAVGDALGRQVTWDSSTKTVYIGDTPTQKESWMKKLPPYQKSLYTNVYYGADATEYFTVSGVRHKEGVVFGSSSGSYALWATNTKYSSMTITVGHVDGSWDENAKLEVYLDGEYSQSYDLEWNTAPKTITIPINNAATVQLNKTDGYGKYGVYDISFN